MICMTAIYPTAWPGQDSQETLPASGTQLEEALKEASIGMVTPENRIRRTMSQPPEISQEKPAMAPKRRKVVVKVIRRKVATPQDQDLQAPAPVPPASEQPCDTQATQLVSPGPEPAGSASHATSHAEQVSSPSAPAASTATGAPQPATATTADTIPETHPETAPEQEMQETQPAAPEPAARPEAVAPPPTQEVQYPPKTAIKAEPATPAAVHVKQEPTDETSSIPTKAEPTSARRHQAVEQAKQDNMNRCNTSSQLGSPAAAGPSVPGEADKHATASKPSGPSNGAAAPSAEPAPAGPVRPTPAAKTHPDSTDDKSNSNDDDDETKSVGGHSSSTSFSQALEKELHELFEERENEARAGDKKKQDNKNAVEKMPPPIPKRRREKTLEEKAIHAKFMRFTRHIQSFLSCISKQSTWLVHAKITGLSMRACMHVLYIMHELYSLLHWIHEVNIE